MCIRDSFQHYAGVKFKSYFLNVIFIEDCHIPLCCRVAYSVYDMCNVNERCLIMFDNCICPVHSVYYTLYLPHSQVSVYHNTAVDEWYHKIVCLCLPCCSAFRSSLSKTNMFEYIFRIMLFR